MIYVEKAIRFIIRHYILAVPLFIMFAIPALINWGGTTSILSNFKINFSDMDSLTRDFQDPSKVIDMFSGYFATAIGSGAIVFMLRFLAYPATYGLVNKAMDTGNADLNDFKPALSQYFGKYIIYWLSSLAVWVIFAVAAGIILIVLALSISVLNLIGVFLVFIAALAVAAAAFALSIFIDLWFPAMVVDDLDVVSALKKSALAVKSVFWVILAVFVMVGIIGALASAIFGFVGLLPLVGPVALSVIPAATSFFMVVLCLFIYRDQTGKQSV